MERRNLLAGLAVLALSLFVLSGTAFAHAAHHKKAKPRGARAPPETCVVHALPASFMDQGEFGSASSVADIVEVECEEVYAEQHVRSAPTSSTAAATSALLADPVAAPRRPRVQPTGPSFSVELDNDGNATAIVLGGPSCAAGESLIAAHLEVAPFTTATTGFTVLPPRPTEPGVFATPEKRSRARPTAMSRRSCRSSSRPCSPRNRSTWTRRVLLALPQLAENRSRSSMGNAGYPEDRPQPRRRLAVPGQRRQRVRGPDR